MGQKSTKLLSKKKKHAHKYSDDDGDDAAILKASRTNDTHDDDSGEHSPLMMDSLAPPPYGSDDDDPLLQQRTHNNPNPATVKAKDAWKKLRHRVDQGDVLLLSPQTAGGGNDSRHRRSRSATHRRRNEALTEIQSTMEYSAPQCLVAVLLYIGVAVCVYSFVFENMTVIDAM